MPESVLTLWIITLMNTTPYLCVSVAAVAPAAVIVSFKYHTPFIRTRVSQLPYL